MRRRSSFAAATILRPGALDLRQLAAKLHPQPRDLDRKAAGFDDLLKEAGVLIGAAVVEHHRERLAAALDRDGLAAVGRPPSTGAPCASTYTWLSGR